MKNFEATEAAYKNGYEAGKKTVTNSKGTIWACAISNMIAMSCCTILAVAFDKWWIILFSFLFFSWPKSVMQHYRVCDGCGKISPYADNYNEALEKAKANGWTHYVDGNKDYCPDCINKL